MPRPVLFTFPPCGGRCPQRCVAARTWAEGGEHTDAHFFLPPFVGSRATLRRRLVRRSSKGEGGSCRGPSVPARPFLIVSSFPPLWGKVAARCEASLWRPEGGEHTDASFSLPPFVGSRATLRQRSCRGPSVSARRDLSAVAQSAKAEAAHRPTEGGDTPANDPYSISELNSPKNAVVTSIRLPNAERPTDSAPSPLLATAPFQT